MKLMITGSRVYRNAAHIADIFGKVERKHGAENIILIQGAAKGADTLCAREAVKRGWKIESHPVNWDKKPDGSINRAAGHERNARMIAREPDAVLAFFQPGDRNAGTQGAMLLAVRKNIPIICFWDTEQCTPDQIIEHLANNPLDAS